MTEIKNVKVYGLEESIIRSGYAMQTGVPESFAVTEKDAKRMSKLGNAKTGSGHDCALKGIVVQFDLKYPEYLSPEMQRYHWFEIITSQSKMHRLTRMNIRESVNEYVDDIVIENLERHVKAFNSTEDKDLKYKFFMKIVSNCPLGLEKWMGITTNYLQLKTMYSQRKNHKLKEDWGAVNEMILNLPMFKELCLGK